jgi:hypothetical protein
MARFKRQAAGATIVQSSIAVEELSQEQRDLWRRVDQLSRAGPVLAVTGKWTELYLGKSESILLDVLRAT